MITRNSLISLFILLMGLAFGFLASRGFLRKLDSGIIEMPVMTDYIGASSFILSNNYYNSRDQFQKVVDEGFEAILGAIEKKDLLLEARDTIESDSGDIDRMIAIVDYGMD